LSYQTIVAGNQIVASPYHYVGLVFYHHRPLVSICASALWITKHAKGHEKHEAISPLSPLFVSFVIQALYNRNLLLRQAIQFVDQRVNLAAGGGECSASSHQVQTRNRVFGAPQAE